MVGVGRYIVLCVALTAGCVRERRGVPLYPSPEVPRARSEVALLIGPIRAVDGWEIDEPQRMFELAPGCHIVEVGGSMGAMDPSQSGYAVKLPRLAYAFRMRAGGTYAIAFEHRPGVGVGPMGWGYVVARATDSAGSAVVPRLTSMDDVSACRAWSPETN